MRMAFQKALQGHRNLSGLLFSNRALPFVFGRQCFHSDNDNFGQNNGNSFESSDDFERRLFGDFDSNTKTDSFFRKLDRLEKNHGRSNASKLNDGDHSRIIDGIGDTFSTLTDGMDEKLDKAAQTFVYNEEIYEDDYKYRPDVTFYPRTTYTLRDLDLTKPGVQKNVKRNEFETSTKEVLKKADFRNVRFLSNFLTEAGIIIKRSQTRISAKAQRKIAREIKTARAFGLMPFTTMGKKPFVFGRSMKDDEEEYEYEDNTRTTAGAEFYGQS
ncbi:hypothetical protein Cni_G04414 [Canna indica]|uniref:Small ribosomal subunit protein bS18c n=1 Tax=Canna indica TaxID=4628 RepID=A0AAQ3Q4G1_9LILI|nr:hypothetical protein Cni_G04414 [Canna indica]